jgi:hypothetical protein
MQVFFYKNLKKMSHNVPVVCDVFLCAIKETKGFQRTKKCAGEKPHKGAQRRLRFFGGQAAVGGAAHTILLCAVRAYSISFSHYFLFHINSIIILSRLFLLYLQWFISRLAVLADHLVVFVHDREKPPNHLAVFASRLAVFLSHSAVFFYDGEKPLSHLAVFLGRPAVFGRRSAVFLSRFPVFANPKKESF